MWETYTVNNIWHIRDLKQQTKRGNPRRIGPVRLKGINYGDRASEKCRELNQRDYGLPYEKIGNSVYLKGEYIGEADQIIINTVIGRQIRIKPTEEQEAAARTRAINYLAYIPSKDEDYCPSNGTEGEIFQGHWCAKCARDSFHETGDSCPILMHHLSGGEYLEQSMNYWRMTPKGPVCLAWLPPLPERQNPSIIPTAPGQLALID
ncbi:hypothetical protein [Nodosilinea nodulosa]|uniref:hypothetical protein n=1 Tax=Nodosilinea nodulosa TaxID=416001 RepID=UPI00035D5C28|nr:hypothetical protein [Nodosilinea nodulosa]